MSAMLPNRKRNLLRTKQLNYKETSRHATKRDGFFLYSSRDGTDTMANARILCRNISYIIQSFVIGRKGFRFVELV